MTTCPECNGTGKGKAFGNFCGRCQGTGRVMNGLPTPKYPQGPMNPEGHAHEFDPQAIMDQLTTLSKAHLKLTLETSREIEALKADIASIKSFLVI